MIVYQLILQSPNGVTGDANGFFPSSVNLFGLQIDTYFKYYYFAFFCVLVFLLIKTNLVYSRVGRALTAIRENSHAADGMGVNVRKYKVLAFAISAFYTGFAGAMYAHLIKYISPDTFTMTLSVMFMTMVLFGGSGSLLGPISECWLSWRLMRVCVRHSNTRC
jgi:branched-chain amino acid transport system permease protein